VCVRHKMAEVLLKNGESLETKTSLGYTLLHRAINRDDIYASEISQALINLRADIDARDDGSTLLHCAAQKSNKEIVRLLLLDNNADVNVKNHRGAIPFRPISYIME
jgi:ankyrin repeat protein